MVSHHPATQSDLVLPPATVHPSSRRSSSVASGRSVTRRHRHARSHHGGGSSAYLPQNEFPVFSHSGDVEIVLRNPSGRKEKRYLLHRLILSQCSGFFEAGTRAEWSARLGDSTNSRPGAGLARISENDSSVGGSSSRASSSERRPSFDQARRRWYYVLDWKGIDEDDVPILVQQETESTSIFGGDPHADRPPQVRSKPPASNERFFRSMANISSLNLNERPRPHSPIEPGDEILKDYDNLFRIMYQYPPSLDSINIATAYSECKGLLHIADMYDALEIVGSRVDHHLLRFGARLFKQIAKYPPSYLKLGYLARSRTIFTEALVHVVGQWPLAAPQLRGQLDTHVMELLEDKVDELHERRERVEAKLWRLNLTTSRGERATPANDFLSYLAVSLFRSWLAENTTPPPAGILKPPSSSASGAPSTTTSTRTDRAGSGGSNGGGGHHHIASQRVPAPGPPPAPSSLGGGGGNGISPGRVYRLMGATDPTGYLTHDELKRALKGPGSQLGVDLYTRENLRRLERRVDEVKNLARDAVRPLVRNELELDLRDFVGPAGLGYLTCTRLEGREVPWEE